MKALIIIFILLSKMNNIFCHSQNDFVLGGIKLIPEYFGFFPAVIVVVFGLLRIQSRLTETRLTEDRLQALAKILKVKEEMRIKTLENIAKIEDLIFDLQQELEELMYEKELLLEEVEGLLPGNLLTDRLFTLEIIGIDLKVGQSKVLDYQSQIYELINLLY